MPAPARNRLPADTLLGAALRTIQRHPVKALQAWTPRFESLDGGRLRSKYSGRELRALILRALALGHGWHDETTPPAILATAAAICLANSTKLTLAGITRATELAGPGLEALDLTNQFPVTDALVASVVQACPSLRVLSLVGCRKVTGASVEALLRLPHLASVDFGGCLNVSAADVGRLLNDHANASRFTGLGLGGLAEPALLGIVARRTGALAWLSLGYSLAPAASLLGAVAANPRLAALLLHWTENASDDLLSSVAVACPDLYHIDVTGCKGVTNAGIVALAAALAPCRPVTATAPGTPAVDVASPSARVWDLDETEWLDFALRCARSAGSSGDGSEGGGGVSAGASAGGGDARMSDSDDQPMSGDAAGTGADIARTPKLRVVLAKHSGATRGVADHLNRMGAVMQLLV